MWNRTEEELLEKSTQVCLRMSRQIKIPDLHLKVCDEDTLRIVNNNKKIYYLGSSPLITSGTSNLVKIAAK